MFKTGLIEQLDEQKCLAKVKFEDLDGVITAWLPVLQTKTLKDKFYIMPDINEQVVCLMDEHLEDGVILGAIYSQDDNTPVTTKDKLHIKLEDGATLEYDKSAKKLSVTTDNIEININNEIKVKAQTEKKTIQSVTYKSNSFTISGNLTVDGQLLVTKGIQSNSLVHVHTSAAPGNPTSPPLTPSL